MYSTWCYLLNFYIILLYCSFILWCELITNKRYSYKRHYARCFTYYYVLSWQQEYFITISTILYSRTIIIISQSLHMRKCKLPKVIEWGVRCERDIGKGIGTCLSRCWSQFNPQHCMWFSENHKGLLLSTNGCDPNNTSNSKVIQVGENKEFEPMNSNSRSEVFLCGELALRLHLEKLRDYFWCVLEDHLRC